MKKNKSLNAVKIKRQGAERTSRVLKGKSVNEELTFWKSKTESLKQFQQSFTKV